MYEYARYQFRSSVDSGKNEIQNNGSTTKTGLGDCEGGCNRGWHRFDKNPALPSSKTGSNISWDTGNSTYSLKTGESTSTKFNSHNSTKFNVHNFIELLTGLILYQSALFDFSSYAVLLVQKSREIVRTTLFKKGKGCVSSNSFLVLPQR